MKAKTLKQPAPRVAAKSPVARLKNQDVIRLFVAGDTTKSRQAVQRVRQQFEAELKNGCELKVIDICLFPKLARENQIVATPTLIVDFQPPVRRFIGNLANTTGLSAGLNLVKNR
jgi:circadian clock protein KaiB